MLGSRCIAQDNNKQHSHVGLDTSCGQSSSEHGISERPTVLNKVVQALQEPICSQACNCATLFCFLLTSFAHPEKSTNWGGGGDEEKCRRKHADCVVGSPLYRTDCRSNLFLAYASRCSIWAGRFAAAPRSSRGTHHSTTALHAHKGAGSTPTCSRPQPHPPPLSTGTSDLDQQKQLTRKALNWTPYCTPPPPSFGLLWPFPRTCVPARLCICMCALVYSRSAATT